jgi:dihydrofolate synthase/folylpolyglutamate synthase
MRGVPITEAEMVEGVNSLRDLIADLMSRESSALPRLLCHPTFFEVSTALAFRHFAESGAEVAILEVGMGGRYDATNVAPSRVSVITNVDWDHQEYLGNQLRQIALEKAGIIKEGGWLISGAIHPEALPVIEQMAREREARLFTLGKDITWRVHEATWQGQEISIKGRNATYPRARMEMLGAHQGANAAAAVGAAEVLQEQGFGITREHIYQGLAKARWPGRMQVVGHRPLMLVDSAHNPAGAQVLARAISRLGGYRRLFLVFGVLQDKDWRSMLGVLGPLAEKIILCRAPSERAADPFALREELKEGGVQIEVREEVAEAISLAKSMAEAEDAILIAGSLFTAAAALGALGVQVV